MPTAWLIRWLIISCRSSHIPHFLFCCVLSIFALTYLVLMAMFCAAIRRDSVSLLNFPFLSHVQIWREISLVCRLKCPYSCFSSHFCFLVIVLLVLFVLFLVAEIRVSMCSFYVVFDRLIMYERDLQCWRFLLLLLDSCISWLCFIGVWVNVNIRESLGLFWPILKMLWFVWPRFWLWFTLTSVFFQVGEDHSKQNQLHLKPPPA